MDGDNHGSAGHNTVSAGYFQTMGIRIVRGRGFSGGDSERSRPVAVVNQRLADMLWPGRDPIRRAQIARPGRALDRSGWYGERRQVSIPLRGSATLLLRPHCPGVHGASGIQVRAAIPADALAPAVEQAIRELDPDLPLYDVQSMTQALGSGLGFFPVRVGAIAVATFGLLAFALAMVGLSRRHVLPDQSADARNRRADGSRGHPTAHRPARVGGWVEARDARCRRGHGVDVGLFPSRGQLPVRRSGSRSPDARERRAGPRRRRLNRVRDSCLACHSRGSGDRSPVRVKPQPPEEHLTAAWRSAFTSRLRTPANDRRRRTRTDDCRRSRGCRWFPACSHTPTQPHPTFETQRRFPCGTYMQRSDRIRHRRATDHTLPQAHPRRRIRSLPRDRQDGISCEHHEPAPRHTLAARARSRDHRHRRCPKQPSVLEADAEHALPPRRDKPPWTALPDDDQRRIVGHAVGVPHIRQQVALPQKAPLDKVVHAERITALVPHQEDVAADC